MMREKTIGIQELKYRVEDRCNMCLTDMGGQRLERKKWIHQFNSADVIVFVVSLSEFNLTCYVSIASSCIGFDIFHTFKLCV